MKLRYRVIVVALVFCAPLFNLYAQTNPAAREDAAIERRQMMKAIDQIEMLTHQIDDMQKDIQQQKQDLEALRTENYKLKQQLALAEMRRSKEREVILAEVSKQIAKASKASSQASESSSKAKVSTEKKSEKGYEHIVKKGQTLWLISRSYKAKGINVSIDDIRKANNMKKGTPLKIGQKLFIPAK